MSEPVQEPTEETPEPDRRGAEDGDPVQRGPDADAATDEEEVAGEEPAKQSEPEGPGESEQTIEEAFKKLGRSATNWRNRVSEVLGESANDLVVCELCGPHLPGFRFPVPLEEEHRAVVRAAIGDLPTRQLLPDPVSQPCPGCDGWGVVATGSKVEGQEALPCTNCKGMGWVGERARAAAPPPPPPAPPAPTNEGASSTPPGVTPEEQEWLSAHGLIGIRAVAPA